MTPFDEPRRVASLRAPRPHDELRRRAGPGVARPALRMGGVRRPRDHRPLGADRRAVDPGAARHPLGRAERESRRPARTTPTCSRSGSRPTRSSRSSSSRRCRRSSPGSLANGGVPYLAHTYWSGLRTDQWEDCEGLARDRGLEHRLRARARPRRLVAALGRGARARPAASTRSRPTTRTTPASTAGSRGPGCALRRRRRRRCSTPCARVRSTGRPGRRSTPSR